MSALQAALTVLKQAGEALRFDEIRKDRLESLSRKEFIDFFVRFCAAARHVLAREIVGVCGGG
jgi:hypothetical protein